jgi:hypothetical protein
MQNAHNPSSLDSPLRRSLRFVGQSIVRERADWPLWWSELPLLRRIFPALFIAIYWASLVALRGFRSDHLLVGSIYLGLAYGGRAVQTLFRFLLPVILTGIVYDSMRFYSDSLRAEVQVAFPYEFDLRWFGIETAEGRLTPNEWWQKNTRWYLDLMTGFFYLFFIAIYVLLCAYHSMILPRLTKDPVQRRKAEKIGSYVTWAFFWVNVLGYSTYYWFPAAPPWYVAEQGLGPAKMDTMASAAGCLRFDELLGTAFFTGMYGRAADVFGAIPSLHIAYPLLSVFFAFHLGSMRAFALGFYLIMCFSAVYLNHHYIIDILWGSAYSLLVFWAVRAYSEWRARRRTI